VVAASDAVTCRGAVAPCLSLENPPLDEVLTARLCFADQVPGLSLLDGGRGHGELPAAGRTCVARTFRPLEEVVEIGPDRGADCRASDECIGRDELCLSGSCTAGCPANDVPQLGASWSLRVASADDRGFFTFSPRGAFTQLAGTGTLASVVFQGATMVLQLRRVGQANEPLTAALAVGLPPPHGVPLVPGTGVSVLVVDGSTRESPTNRAVVVRDSTTGAVLFAADMAQGGPLLRPADVAPFSVGSTEVALACRLDDCGRWLHFSAIFTSPAGAVVVEPGKAVSISGPLGTHRFLAVANGRYSGSTACSQTDLRPWALWREAGP
jgi:hypothetical protein